MKIKRFLSVVLIASFGLVICSCVHQRNYRFSDGIFQGSELAAIAEGDCWDVHVNQEVSEDSRNGWLLIKPGAVTVSGRIAWEWPIKDRFGQERRKWRADYNEKAMTFDAKAGHTYILRGLPGTPNWVLGIYNKNDWVLYIWDRYKDVGGNKHETFIVE